MSKRWLIAIGSLSLVLFLGAATPAYLQKGLNLSDLPNKALALANLLAPGASGNCPISTGTAWVSLPCSAAGGINQLTGDVVAGPGTGPQSATLSATGVTAGAYTNPDLTIDAKGRITLATAGAGLPTPGAVGTCLVSTGPTTPPTWQNCGTSPPTPSGTLVSGGANLLTIGGDLATQ